MNVLCINCGSSSLRFDLMEARSGSQAGPERIASGSIDRVGGKANLVLSVPGAPSQERLQPVKDHSEAMQEAVALLDQAGLLAGVEAVGHRVVHGGPELSAPAVIDGAVIAAVRAVSELALLHNQPALEAIAGCRARFGDALPMVATFDTAFYAELPEVAASYALPKQLTQELGIRRFGFHGLAHRYMIEAFRTARPDATSPRLITLQLGNGCSATASLDGRPLDTSMGFTPLEGLVMGTRSGDVDPSLPLFLATKRGLSPDQVESLLNRQSGLLGLSGLSHDMRDLLAAAAQGHAGAALAVDQFCYRVRRYVGAYMSVLGGADAVVFGGGIGENSPAVRERICRGLEWAGLHLNGEANETLSGEAARISREGSRVEAWVVRVDEAAIIARDTVASLPLSAR
jgi:acetate kinase